MTDNKDTWAYPAPPKPGLTEVRIRATGELMWDTGTAGPNTLLPPLNVRYLIDAHGEVRLFDIRAFQAV